MTAKTVTGCWIVQYADGRPRYDEGNAHTTELGAVSEVTDYEEDASFWGTRVPALVAAPVPECVVIHCNACAGQLAEDERPLHVPPTDVPAILARLSWQTRGDAHVCPECVAVGAAVAS